MRGKQGSDRTSRGYCGWHTTLAGNQVYLRSKLEYIVAKWLDMKNVTYRTESHIYYIDGLSYKPDFFIHNKRGNLVRVIEVKYTNDEKIEYLTKYKSFFNSIGISYVVLSKKQIDKIEKKYKSIKHDADVWCIESASIIHDMRGEKNPHYGLVHSDNTKKIIGDSTKRRFETVDFKKKHRDAMLNWMTDERKEHLSKIMTGKPTKLVDKTSIMTTCEYCGGDVDGVEWYKNGMLMKSEIKKCCSRKCYCSLVGREIVEEKKQNQIRLMDNYYNINGYYMNRKDFVMYCKENGVKCDIRSTFGTHTNFIKYMEAVNG